MSRYYDKNFYSPVSRTQYIGAQKAETEISPETEQSSPQIASEKSPKPKGKEKQLYHWCHTRGSHHGVIEGFFAENDKEAKHIVEAATSAHRWNKPWQKQNPDIGEYVKYRGDGESIKLFKCRGVPCGACLANAS
ncbi:hypothetical protein F4X88_15780 [Candidatus Poribacteria bacterium]|nr:hypothetical protein [Candidatus Poribacteria bacterium]